MPGEQPSHFCIKTAELEALRANVLELTRLHAEMNAIQKQHADLLKTLAEERLKNVEFKAKVGGIVLATGTIVSLFWGAVLGIAQLLKTFKSGG